MLNPYRYLMLFFVTLAMACFGPAHAAGSGGGGMGSGSYSADTPALSAEERAAKAFRTGLRHRDRALKQEAKAAKASSEKARDKALAKAQKAYQKAAEKQGEALSLDPQHYAAANELGFALRKTGEFKKAIGAYNYALEINPDYHPATEYRGEAFLALGMYEQSKKAYMQLFRNDRALADQLMRAFDIWLNERGDQSSAEEQAFAAWIAERKQLAQITADLSMHNTRSW